jgi:hypothetical protein
VRWEEGALMVPEGKLSRIASRCTNYCNMQLPNIARVTGEQVSGEAEARQAVDSFEGSLRVLLGVYAFARAGAEQAGYYSLALEAANTVLAAPYTGDDFADRVWRSFQESCERKGVRANPRLNRGVTEGFAVWGARDRSRGLFPQIAETVVTRGAESAFLQLYAVKGVGPKIAAFILRDAVWLYECEAQVAPTELMYLQPIDIWVRRVAAMLWPDLAPLSGKDIPDFMLARRIAMACVEEEVSGVAWNQGAWWLGAQEAKNQEQLRSLFEQLSKGH